MIKNYLRNDQDLDHSTLNWLNYGQIANQLINATVNVLRIQQTHFYDIRYILDESKLGLVCVINLIFSPFVSAINFIDGSQYQLICLLKKIMLTDVSDFAVFFCRKLSHLFWTKILQYTKGYQKSQYSSLEISEF